LVIGVVALCLCLCLGLIAGLGGLTYLGYRVDRADAVSALRDYLEEIRAENYPAAYDRLCDNAKTGVSRDEYAQRFLPPRLASFRIGETSLATHNGEDGYDVAVELRFEDGQTRTERYFVFSRTDNVDRYYICPPGT
jgi:hypothetical protein